MKRRLVLAAAVVATGAVTLPSGAHSGHDRNARAMRFYQPIRVTPELSGGADPAVAVDAFGNIVVTAAKDSATPVVAPDRRGTVPARAASWRLMSVDQGETWQNLPGGPAGPADGLLPGLEPDVALDGKGTFYVLDGYRADASLTRYDSRGRDRITRGAVSVRPTVRADVRPFVAAHGAGVVLTIAAGDPANAPAPAGGQPGTGFGPGRYEVYSSSDGGMGGPVGYPLRDSDVCRPAAEQRAGSKRMVVACLDGLGTVFAFLSTDDGETFDRFPVGRYDTRDGSPGVPSATFAPDGSVHVLIADPVAFSATGAPTASRLRLFSSPDGRRWRTRDVTDAPGVYRQPTIAAGPDGRLGVAAYYRLTPAADWTVVAGSLRPRDRTVYLTSFAHDDPVAPATSAEPPGTFLSLTWAADRRMHIVWTRVGDAADTGLMTEVWHVRSF
ncbi:MAG TPA: sialidase family protein [Mycobacteriales bacterium]|nr:sialidase family protein [Mycobacteriales bacterium]